MKIKMDNFAEINWSAVAREAFDGKIRDMEIIKNSQETEHLYTKVNNIIH